MADSIAALHSKATVAFKPMLYDNNASLKILTEESLNIIAVSVNPFVFIIFSQQLSAVIWRL
ncbi:hypothetical protein AOG55_05290 [Acidiplasma cupricumulans]|uniref:Uncharacterized protein n=1 Tax=Acidiplasma cupricumulans TaxID=312540 RepID=A0A0Q0RUI8_9ARCH|nr:hypothetical protein AOG55_05290 [Acidiplasma cupricumulans]